MSATLRATMAHTLLDRQAVLHAYRPFTAIAPVRASRRIASLRRLCPQASAAVTDAPSTSAPAVAHHAPLFKAALDFKSMKENLDLYVQNTKDRLSSADPAKVVELYDQFVKLKSDADALRAERNENANAMKVS